MSSNRICAKCLQNQPSLNYLKNTGSNLFFRTCLNCRNSQKARRQNIRRQRQVPVPNLEVEDEVDGPNISKFIFMPT